MSSQTKSNSNNIQQKTSTSCNTTNNHSDTNSVKENSPIPGQEYKVYANNQLERELYEAYMPDTSYSRQKRYIVYKEDVWHPMHLGANMIEY
jgi:hypothetical protein